MTAGAGCGSDPEPPPAQPWEQSGGAEAPAAATEPAEPAPAEKKSAEPATPEKPAEPSSAPADGAEAGEQAAGSRAETSGQSKEGAGGEDESRQ